MSPAQLAESAAHPLADHRDQDNAIVLAIPGAMDAGQTDLLFWGDLAISLVVAGIAAFPVNRWLIARVAAHAVVHKYHSH